MTEQTTVTLNVSLAVEAELRRIVVDTERVVGPDGYRSYRPWVYRIIRDAVPGMTRELWINWAGREPDRSREPGHENDARAQYERDRALLRHHGYSVCCPDCDAGTAGRLRQDLAGRGEPTEAPGHQAADPVRLGPVDMPQEPVQERTCQCDDCEDDRCQGDCSPCDDHGCEACYGDHEVSGCCGYCYTCGNHPSDTDSDCYARCSECDHCTECDHICQ